LVYFSKETEPNVEPNFTKTFGNYFRGISMITKNIYHLFLLIFLITTDGCLLAKRAFKFSSEPISPQIEMFILDLQKELHMESCNIKIKNLCEENAMVITIPFSGRYLMALNEKWFNAFSEEAKRFIIGHELMHIQHKHVGKKVALYCAWPTVDSIFMPGFRKVFSYGNAPKKLFLLWYSRSIEKDADISCAKKLHCANGGIEFFESLEKKDVKTPSSRVVLLDHPMNRVRLNYLQELAQSEKYRNSLCA